MTTSIQNTHDFNFILDTLQRLGESCGRDANALIAERNAIASDKQISDNEIHAAVTLDLELLRQNALVNNVIIAREALRRLGGVSFSASPMMDFATTTIDNDNKNVLAFSATIYSSPESLSGSDNIKLPPLLISTDDFTFWYWIKFNAPTLYAQVPPFSDS